MLDTFRKFLKERGLILNSDKTKVMVFNRKGRKRKERWKWKGMELEEVQTLNISGLFLITMGVIQTI